MPIDGPGGLYSRPYVAATNGRRAGPISGYFEAVDPGGVPAPAWKSCYLPNAIESTSTVTAPRWRLTTGDVPASISRTLESKARLA